MQSVGICGSDVRFWQWGKVGHFNLIDPLVMGHEGSGCVVAIGDGVKHLQVGMCIVMVLRYIHLNDVISYI